MVSLCQDRALQEGQQDCVDLLSNIFNKNSSTSSKLITAQVSTLSVQVSVPANAQIPVP